MSRQPIRLSRPTAWPWVSPRSGRPIILLLAAVGVFLIIVSRPRAEEPLPPVVKPQDRPAEPEPQTGRIKLLDTLNGHKFIVGFAAFSDGGKTLVSGGGGNAKYPGAEIKSWDVATRKNTATISLTERFSGGMALSPDGKTVALGLLTDQESGGNVRLYDLAKGKKSLDIATVDAPYNVQFSPDGKVLAWGEEVSPGKIRLWNLAAGKLLGTLTSPNRATIPSVAFSPDSKTLAAGGMDGPAAIWDVGSGDNPKTFPASRNSYARPYVAFSPDGKKES